MNRRLFFRALAGAPVAALPQKPKAEVLLSLCRPCVCAGCGSQLPTQRLDYDSPEFVKCPVETCPQYNKALLVPRVEVPTTYADPKQVKAVEERERRRAKEEAQLLASIRKNADYVIGSTVQVKKPARFIVETR